MADISKVKLPSGNVYDIKDAVARQAISGGISFVVSWDGASVPVVANIPAGVVVTYNGTDYTGTKAASTAEAGTFYLVKSSSEALDIYSEYVAIGEVGSKTWEKIGDTAVDLSSLGALAYKDSVTLAKGSGDNVLGEATTFSNSSSSVTFSGQATDKCLGSDATFSTTVTPTTTNIKATASGTAVGADGTASVVTGYASPSSDTFVKSYPGATSKLATTTVSNVTSVGSASDWSFAMGTGADAETLIISGGNGTAPTLGTAKTVATGSLSATGGGGTVMTGLGTASTGSAMTGLGTASTETVLKGVKVTSQPAIALATGATAGTGVISVATGITSASTSVSNKDEVTAVTNVGTGTAAAQTITVGTNDKIKIAKYDDLGVSAS